MGDFCDSCVLIYIFSGNHHHTTMDTLRTMQQHVTASWKQNQGLLLGTTVLVVVAGHWIWQWWWNSSSSVPSGSSHQSRLLDELNPLPTDLRLHENQDQQTKVQPKTEEETDGKQHDPEDHLTNQTRPPPSTAAAETTTNTRSSSSSSLSTIASHCWWIPKWWLPDCRRRQRP